VAGLALPRAFRRPRFHEKTGFEMKRWTVAVLLLCVAPLVGCSSSKESLIVKKKQDRKNLRVPPPRNEPSAPRPVGGG
jgi:hypothetical protein